MQERKRLIEILSRKVHPREGIDPAVVVADYLLDNDIVPVVRCRDCKWYREGEKLAPIKFCFRLQHPTENRQIGYNFADDDYCSYGEREEKNRDA